MSDIKTISKPIKITIPNSTKTVLFVYFFILITLSYYLIDTMTFCLVCNVVDSRKDGREGHYKTQTDAEIEPEAC